MSGLHGFNMFQLQEGGFTEKFVTQCGKELKNCAEKLMELIKKDEGYDGMTALRFETTKTYLRGTIEDIGHYHFCLETKYLEFLAEQKALVHELLADAPFDDGINDFDEMASICHEFREQHKDCLEGIHQIFYEDLSEDLYHQYKCDLLMHIQGLKDKNSVFVKMLVQGHVNNTYKVLDAAKLNYANLMSKLYQCFKTVEDSIPDANTELRDLKSELDAFGEKALTLSNDIVTSKKIEILEELGILGDKAKATAKKYENRNANWERYINKFKVSINKRFEDLYKAEVVMNGVKLKGLVEIRSIQKQCLQEEVKTRIDLLKTQLEFNVSRAMNLLQKHVHISDFLMPLME